MCKFMAPPQNHTSKPPYDQISNVQIHGTKSEDSVCVNSYYIVISMSYTLSVETNIVDAGILDGGEENYYNFSRGATCNRLLGLDGDCECVWLSFLRFQNHS